MDPGALSDIWYCFPEHFSGDWAISPSPRNRNRRRFLEQIIKNGQYH
jgi:hypothetical protein